MSLLQTRAALVTLCVSRAGPIAGARQVVFITEWELCVRAHGRPVTIDEFIRWSPRRYPRRSADRHVAEFRELFPQLGPRALPHDLMRPLLERLTEERELAEDVELPLEVPV